MRLFLDPTSDDLARLAAEDRARDPRIERASRRIVDDVRRRGDAALGAWRRRLDRDVSPLEVTAAELRAGWAATPRLLRDAIRTAVRHVATVAERQRPRPLTVRPAPGIRIDQAVVPLERVGCYVPGGRYPLPSTLIMTVVPARVAGVLEIVVACPKPSAAVLCAALEAGAGRLLRMGGAQAIGALAYGTEAVARVDKIVGPGNAWVAAAKAYVAADCAVDMHAGPSEIVVWSASGRADWIAADLIAQAEHDPAARAFLVTTRRALADRVADRIRAAVGPDHPARPALDSHGAILVARDRRHAAAIVNALSPEHLVCDRAADAEGIHAGTVFVGRWSAQAAGDYATGSNHVLPTGGAARRRGGLSAADFVRVYTVQTLTARGLRGIAAPVVALAEAEGLSGHAASVKVRVS